MITIYLISYVILVRVCLPIKDLLSEAATAAAVVAAAVAAVVAVVVAAVVAAVVARATYYRSSLNIYL